MCLASRAGLTGRDVLLSAMAVATGDYNCEFCDPLPDECSCPVCKLVQKEPHQITCCGKIFCKRCLNRLAQNNNACPNCRSNFIKKKKYFPDVATEKKIKHLRIRCQNQNKGCAWIGFLKDIKSHLLQCPYQLIPCTNNKKYRRYSGIIQNFGALVERRELQKHMTEECEWRQVACIHCSTKGIYSFIKGSHIEECPNVLVTCKNDGCNNSVKRSLLLKHQESCPKAIVPCKYSFIGCKEQVRREDMKSHIQECMEEHLEKTVDTLKKTVNKLEEALQRIEKLEDKKKPRSAPQRHYCYQCNTHHNPHSGCIGNTGCYNSYYNDDD